MLESIFSYGASCSVMGENLSLKLSNLEHAGTEFLQAGYRFVLPKYVSEK